MRQLGHFVVDFLKREDGPTAVEYAVMLALDTSELVEICKDILHSFARSMRDDFAVYAIKATKVALTDAQVKVKNLPPQMTAKESASRYEKFTGQYGTNTFELEAVPPADLQHILRDAIDGVLDVDAFNAEIDAEKSDSRQLDVFCRQMRTMLDGVKLDHGQVSDDEANSRPSPVMPSRCPSTRTSSRRSRTSGRSCG
jgi:hypothetical protein